MNLLTILLVAIVCALIVGLIDRAPILDTTWKTIIKWITIIGFFIWLLMGYHVFSYLGNVKF